MSGRLKKACPRRMARTSGRAVSLRANSSPWPKRMRPRRIAASNTGWLCGW